MRSDSFVNYTCVSLLAGIVAFCLGVLMTAQESARAIERASDTGYQRAWTECEAVGDYIPPQE